MGKLNKNFNLKDEAVFISLASHALNIVETNDPRYDPRVVKLAKAINNYFHKNGMIKRYSRSRGLRIAKFLKEKIEPIIESNSSSVVNIVIILEYLIKEIKHYETMVNFSIYRHIIDELLYELETTEHREVLYDHQERLSKIRDISTEGL